MTRPHELEDHEHDRGLSHDLPRFVERAGLGRRGLLALFGGVGTAEGVPLTLRLKVCDLNGDDASILKGAAVHVWHCTREGEYSMYADAIKDENLLRGVQETDAQGWVEFTSIFPAAYSGRWPHVHFEVYPSLDDATSASNKLRTSQLALPKDVCTQVYEADGYEQVVTNLAQSSPDSDNVFGDGYPLQLAKVTGSNERGWVATLNVPV